MMKSRHTTIECERNANLWGFVALLLVLACITLAWVAILAALLQAPWLAIAAAMSVPAVWAGKTRAVAKARYWDDSRLRLMAEKARLNRRPTTTSIVWDSKGFDLE